MKKWNQLTHLKEMLGSEKALDELTDFMSSRDFQEAYEHITNMWDIQNAESYE